jgi:hypothetical protein
MILAGILALIYPTLSRRKIEALSRNWRRVLHSLTRPHNM